LLASAAPAVPAGDIFLADLPDGRGAEDFPELAADVFPAMDGGITLSTDEIKGRN